MWSAHLNVCSSLVDQIFPLLLVAVIIDLFSGGVLLHGLFEITEVGVTRLKTFVVYVDKSEG